MCLYPHARPLASILRRLVPGYFVKDNQVIKYVGLATDANDVRTEVATFQETDHSRWRFLRRTLRLRVSGRRVMMMFNALPRE